MRLLAIGTHIKSLNKTDRLVKLHNIYIFTKAVFKQNGEYRHDFGVWRSL